MQHNTLNSSMQRNRSRPDPVSCQSCRSKKLKCNRVQPCANCTSRGISCHFLVPPSKLTRTASTVEGIPDILSRIERLETIVLREQPATGVYSTKVADDSPRTTLSTVTTGSQTRDDQSQLLCNIRIGDNSLVSWIDRYVSTRKLVPT